MSGFTREIFRLSGWDPERGTPCRTADFPLPASPPASSVLTHDHGIIAPWGARLTEYLATIRRRSIPRKCSSFVVVSEVDWGHGAEHMWKRHQLTVAEATEALDDVDALWFEPDPHSSSGQSVRVIGFSHSKRAVLTVVLVHREDGQGYWGANGWASNGSDRRRYEGAQ